MTIIHEENKYRELKESIVLNAVVNMNEIVNKSLLAGGKYMPKRHLKQPGFTYSTCEAFTKNKERIQKFNETVETLFIYRN